MLFGDGQDAFPRRARHFFEAGAMLLVKQSKWVRPPKSCATLGSGARASKPWFAVVLFCNFVFAQRGHRESY